MTSNNELHSPTAPATDSPSAGEQKMSPDAPSPAEPTPAAGSLWRSQTARLPTRFGEFRMTVFRDSEGKEHIALQMGPTEGAPPLVRVHSECLTGDVLGSVRCDCRDQLAEAMRVIGREGRGTLLYMRQEGRGIGLANKLHAYVLQDEGLDTVDANLQLGLPVDGRTYQTAGEMLRQLHLPRVRLLTNNPEKVRGLQAAGIEVVERVAHVVPPRPENRRYLQTKAERLGHRIAGVTAPPPADADALSAMETPSAEQPPSSTRPAAKHGSTE